MLKTFIQNHVNTALIITHKLLLTFNVLLQAVPLFAFKMRHKHDIDAYLKACDF